MDDTVIVFFLEDVQLPGILVDDIGEHGLKAGEVCTALGIVDVVAETKYFLVELVNILESCFNFNSFTLSGQRDYLCHSFLGLVHIPDKAGNSVGFMKFDIFLDAGSLVFKYYCEPGIKVSCLMKSGFDVVFSEPGLFKNLGIGKEAYPCACLSGTAHSLKKSVLKLLGGIPPLIGILIDESLCLYANLHPG